ncbi:MAG: RND family efflux transporter MFP subunit [Alteromonadaceae bacterium]|jgi:RND family efflux transporter MFP subunit
MKKTLLFGLVSLLSLSAWAAEPTKPQSPTKVTLVSTNSAQQLAFHPIKSAPAKVITLNHAKIPARVAGILQQLNYRVGDTVKQGDVIAQLDCEDIKLIQGQIDADKQKAQVMLAFNQRELVRANKLSKNQSLSEAELDRNKTEVSTSKIQLAALKLSLKQQQLNTQRCTVKAPFDGIITARLVNVSEQISQGQTLVELLQSTEQEVSAQIALSDEKSFAKASRYWFEIDGKKWPLQLRHVVPLIKDDSRSLESRLVFTTQATYSGATGRVKWTSQRPHLPGYLLQQRQDQLGFFIVKNNHAHFITVPDAQEGRPIPVEPNSDHQLIIDGRFGLTDQQAIRLKKTATDTLITKKD